MTLGIGLARVSTGSQDEASQVRDITADAAARGIALVKIIRLHGYSASHRTAGARAARDHRGAWSAGSWSTLLVTDSNRIDRREDLDAQAAVLLAIRSAGGDVISNLPSRTTAEPRFRLAYRHPRSAARERGKI